MKALCPIHQEDTPSFIYNPKMLNFHCFGCGCNVDIIDAYMMAGDTYLGAVEKLFQETGIAYSFGERGVKTQRSYRYPTEIPVGDRSAVNKYFATRKISEQTLNHCDVRQDEHGNAVFNYYDTNDVLTMVKYRPSRKIDKSKGEIKSWCQKGADTKPLLFNMNRVNTNQPLLITEGECFPGHAEILTPDGWVQFDHYKTQKVLQVNRDPHSGELTGEFVTPKGFVVAKRDGFLSSIRGKRYTSVTTKGHHIVGMDSLGNFKRIDAETFPRGVLHSIPISVRLDGEGLPLSKDKIAFIIAVAENCVAKVIRWKDDSSLCKFVAKRRKKQWRMRRLLRRLKIPYRDFDGVLKFYLPIWATEILKQVKILDEENGGSLYAYRLPYSLVEKSSHLDKLRILDAVLRWGNGCITTYENAKVIQTIAHTCGYSCEIKYRLGSIEEPYHVYVSNQHNAFASDLTYKEVPYHGMVYCVTVDSGMILVRQGGRITVSGNCDTMAAIEAGYTNAVSVPLGSQNHHWIEENMEWLDQFSEIIICADNDQPGYRMVKDVCPRLGAWRTKVVEIPDTDPDTGKRIKDLNELLYYRGKQEVLDAILNAKESQINSVEDLSDVDDVNISDIDGIYFGMESLDRELFKLFFGTLTLVTGRPGSGKTSFLYQLVCNTLEQNRPAWIYSRELPDFMSKSWLNYLLAGPRNLEQYTGRSGSIYYRVRAPAKKAINECYRGQWFVYKDAWSNDVDAIQESMEASARKHGTKLFLLDNLMTINLHSSDENKYDKQTEFINWLIQFASKFSVCVILVAHPRKIQSGISAASAVDLYDIGGSSNLVNLAHRTLSLRRVTTAEKEQGTSKFAQYSCVVSVTKDRMRGRAGFELGMYYDDACRRFYTNYEEYDRKYRWDTSSYHDRIPCPPLDAEEEVFGEIKREEGV